VAVKIRLMRVGKKKQPTYRVVVADSRSPRDGRFIEIIGQYAPRAEPSVVQIDTDRAVDWLRRGAQPTEQTAKLLEIAGVWDAFRGATGRDAAAKPPARRPAKPGAAVKAEPEPPAEPAPGAASQDAQGATADDGAEASE
jgi:small subunit ribosomal protein S16